MLLIAYISVTVFQIIFIFTVKHLHLAVSYVWLVWQIRQRLLKYKSANIFDVLIYSHMHSMKEVHIKRSV